MPCDGVKSGPALLRSRVVGLEDSQEVFSDNLPDILLRVVSLQESLGDIKEQIGVAIAPARHGGAGGLVYDATDRWHRLPRGMIMGEAVGVATANHDPFGSDAGLFRRGTQARTSHLNSEVC